MNDSTSVTTSPASDAISDNSGGKGRSFSLVPIVAFVAIWLGGSWLVVGAWLHPVLPGGWWTIAAGFALMPFPVRSLARGFQGVSYPSAATRLLVFRPFWYAMLFVPLLATGILLGALVGLPFGAAASLGRWSAAVTAPLLGIVALTGYVGSRRLVVRRLDVRLPRLPASFDGLRVMQLSDLHVGPHTSGRLLDHIKRAVRDEEPDLILFTGDQVDDFARDVGHFNNVFGDLHAPLGVFAVPANHDVSPGSNFWGIPLRLGTSPEVTVLTLEADPEGEAAIVEPRT